MIMVKILMTSLLIVFLNKLDWPAQQHTSNVHKRSRRDLLMDMSKTDIKQKLFKRVEVSYDTVNILKQSEKFKYEFICQL